ncbi:hypothetical protein TNCV_2291871 [Trichonephila clavipes]|uniref:DDE Tnp4 domain-containing protein n=1 Tax=Trichonephila clavipes TaxID=2585209 RepID=A0A8X6V7U3_TRICX|nr:hypothetical protein TNCV_2291871 [Trichonephila clavipes]
MSKTSMTNAKSSQADIMFALVVRGIGRLRVSEQIPTDKRKYRVPAIVVACCVLHNLCIRLEDPEPPADPQIEASSTPIRAENEDATLSF